MKKLGLFIALVISTNVFAQILDPVKWTTSVEKLSETEYKLISTATIDAGWHLYSQTVPDGGPIPTGFIYERNGKYLKKGNTKEDKGHTIEDPVFEMEIKYFENQATFKQRIKLKAKGVFVINATIEYMVCNDTQCLPPTEVDLVFEIK
jgi:Thiol:disulfide interchange protein DsbD, N-terminal